MAKISQYAPDNGPSLTDYLIGVEASGPTTKRYILSDLLTIFLNNIPASEGSFGFISSGMVWSGDAYASTRAASMTSGRVKVNTTFLSMSAVTARIFTASKDTYIDILDNGDGTGTLVYTEVSNNAASPTLATNSLRIAIIVTGATTIAAVGSINQGEENKVLPIASSIPYAVTDSLGNLISPRDPNRVLLGYRQNIADVTTTSATAVQITELSIPLSSLSTVRKIKVKVKIPTLFTSGNNAIGIVVYDGTVPSGTKIAEVTLSQTDSGQATNLDLERIFTPNSSSMTLNAGFYINGGSTFHTNTSSSVPAFISVEQR